MSNQNMKYSNQRKLVFSVPFLAGIVIVGFLIVNGTNNLKWDSILIQVLIDLCLVVVFTLILNRLGKVETDLSSLKQTILIQSLDSNTDDNQLIEIIKHYFKEGGEAKLTLRNRKFTKFSMNLIKNFNCELMDCVLENHINQEPNGITFISSVDESNFKAFLNDVTFKFYEFRKCNFTNESYKLKFEQCTFKDVNFSGTRIVESTFNIDLDSSNLMFYKTDISSSRILSNTSLADINFDGSARNSMDYLIKLKKDGLVNKKWNEIIKFNSHSKLKDLTMSADIYLSIYKSYRKQMENIAIWPGMGLVQINPSNFGGETTIYKMN